MPESQQKNRDWENVPGVWAGEEPTLAFLAELPAGTREIRLAAASVYRLRIDGKVIAYGPARAPLGFARTERIAVKQNAPALAAIEVTACQTENFLRKIKPRCFAFTR